mmetsp:Transcript_5735/g.13436  ORF Transcript_5735/g.13436 Transcript_5735/m.13436 type:complete len:251 (+) Transcript_5735:51-803(+)
MAGAQRGLLLAGAAGTGCLVAFGVTQMRVGPEGNKISWPTERARRDTFDGLSKKWDETVRWDEMISGIGRLRRRLVQHATGDVLEVAVGSGRNFAYYSSNKVTSLTAVDFSKGMLEVADSKRQEVAPIPLKLKVASTHKLEFEDDSFDTVVDTFGICSFEKPVQALQELKRVCKPDGQVLLLEHGASGWELVQGFLNSSVHRHVSKYGCYPNRDIVKLVKEAGFHIVVNERKHFGTTYFLVLSPTPLVEE